MKALERAIIRKIGQETGWEHVLSSQDSEVRLASAHHPAQVLISVEPPSSVWTLRFSGSPLEKELARTFPADVLENQGFCASNEEYLAGLLYRAAALAHSLPNQAALVYADQVRKELERHPPENTEVERMVRMRVGQDVFRRALLEFWEEGCSVTGVRLPAVLRASHAKPWADCESDEERLDVFNGVLLVANLDALFDRGLITFDSLGVLVCSSTLAQDVRSKLGIDVPLRMRWIRPEHEKFLIWHREMVFVA